MSPKAHGSCNHPVQSKLRYGCDVETADRICKSYIFSLHSTNEVAISSITPLTAVYAM